MSNIKKKQHYVFQAYLKNWCNEDGKLWVYNKKDKRIFLTGTENILNKRGLYQLKNMNTDEESFFNFYMDCLQVSDETKADIRRHIKLYLVPFMYKGVLELLEKHNPVPDDHPLKVGLQKDFENLHNVIEEGIANTGEDFYCDYEISGLNYIRSIIDGDLDFYYPPIDNEHILSKKHEMNDKRNDFYIFLFIQYFRTVGMRKILQKNMQDMINLIKDYENKNKKKIKNWGLNNVNVENLVPHLSLLFAGLCADAFIKRKPHLSVLKNETEDMFLTSDQPIINLESKYNGSMPDEFVLYYPLSPTIAIVINGSNVENEIVINDENIVRHYNKKLVKDAHEFIVSNNKEQL